MAKPADIYPEVVMDPPAGVQPTDKVWFASHDIEACNFDFFNDTGGTIAAGSTIKIGCLRGKTLHPICNGYPGVANYDRAGARGRRMYLPEGMELESDLCFGDPVNNPDTGEFEGFAIGNSEIPGGVPGLVNRLVVAPAGSRCVWLVCLPATKQPE